MKKPDLHRQQTPSRNVWLPFSRPSANATIRLFCLPFAGGGASAYRLWRDKLPLSVDVCPVQIPGRETRFREPAHQRIGPLVAAIADGISAFLDRPIAFFGHSLGALIAFELARELRGRGQNLATNLFVSGRSAPHLPLTHAPMHQLPEREFREELRRLKGTPESVLDNDELMSIVMPTLRADFAISEAYEFTERRPLECPILALGGSTDRFAPLADLEAWRRHTCAAFDVRILEGEHFFLQTNRRALLRIIAQHLESVPEA